MAKIVGLDPSIKKAGFCVLDTDMPDDHFLERGRLTTSTKDGILVERLILQQLQVRTLLERDDIKFVSMEAPYFGGDESEHLFALNQYLHKVFLDLEIFVICFPPQQLKKLAVPGKSVNDIHKPQMVGKVKDLFNLHGQVVTDDEADAMHAGRLGKLFYQWYFEKKIKDSDLPEDVYKVFAGTHTYTRGPKKGITIREGLIYRENELFFDFKKVSERGEKYHGRKEVIIKGRDQEGRSKKSSKKI
jgi:Holliday junction resolvasome RuvABC endonuclease subunit